MIKNRPSDHDPLSYIKDWQENTSPQTHSRELGISAEFFHSCLCLFKLIISQLNTDSTFSCQQLESIQRSFGLFQLWGDGYQVSEGRLENILNRSHTLYKSTLGLLCSIAEVLVSSRPGKR